MKKEEINEMVQLRSLLISKFDRLRDYKNNPNAIMKEVDYAKSLHETIVAIDKIIQNHVEFSDKK